MLTQDDRRNLDQLKRLTQVIRDFIGGVVLHRHTGLFVGGRGGIGKSFIVESELTNRGEAYKLWNSAMTARCLFDRFAAYPEAVHVIEDIETLTRDRRAIGVLRSALWGTRRGRDGRMERLITWNAKGSSSDTIFTGGVIMTSNRRLADLPELEALKTRISWINMDVSDPEIIALMRSIAAEGWPQGNVELEPDQCREVVDFIVAEAARTNRRLDMRLMVHAFEDRIQFDDLDTGCDWRDLVSTRIRERPTVIGDIESAGVRSQKKAHQLAIAREITGVSSDERLRAWRERTGGLSRATMYRRLGELAARDAIDFDS
jgi:hypothetical protein